MAEVKNSFLSSKMNKDLDDRLIPNGEYRNAVNVSINKSTGENVGTVQTVLGNQEIIDIGTFLGKSNLEFIGVLPDDVSGKVFCFLTNNTLQPYITSGGVGLGRTFPEEQSVEAFAGQVIIGGSGYTTGSATSTGGTGSGLTFSITSIGAGGSITGITVTSEGSGYTAGDVVNIVTSSSSSASYIINTIGGPISFVGTTPYGTGYTAGTYIAATTAQGSSTGTGLTLLITVDASGNVTSAKIDKFGSGYAVGDTVAINGGNNDAILRIDFILQSDNFILSYNVSTANVQVIAQGSFLNFSTLNPITGINLLEDLLFFTDNRNQPRKVNITRTNPYYTTEEQLSVAKYYPYDPIQLYQPSKLPGAVLSTYTLAAVNNSTTLTFQTPASGANPVLTHGSLGVIGFSLTITNGGTGYSLGSAITTGENVTGTGLTVNITGVSGGVITAATVSNPGANYTSGTTVRVLQPGSGEDALLTVNFITQNTFLDITQADWPNSITVNQPQTMPAGSTVDLVFPETTLQDAISEYLPVQADATIYKAVNANQFQVRLDSYTGDQLIGGTNVFIEDSSGNFNNTNSVVGTVTVDSSTYAPLVVLTINVAPAITNSDYVAIVGGTPGASNLKVKFSLANPYFDQVFKENANVDFLDDKFVRFSYRFKFDDGEYSLMAPFTQPCFIPEQDGYFTLQEFGRNSANRNSIPDTERAYRSTVVDFMQNKVNKILLNIPLPCAANDIMSKYKVQEIDVLYKESDQTTIKVVETVPVEFNVVGSSSYYQYEYGSKPPFKTLPQDETVRVYDKVPVKALAQEVASNRIIYGNYQDKHTPPKFLDYIVGAKPKASTFTIANNEIIDFTSSVEYPNASLKQNRNYEIGVVLSDIFGRQSTVLFSQTRLNFQSSFLASTVYSPYRSKLDNASNSSNPTNGLPYFDGSALRIQFNNLITSFKNPNTGTPGLYNSDITSQDYNPLGWYSFKIVVKQTEQDYYNVYLPTAMAAYPLDKDREVDTTSHVILYGDNINKVPRSLIEVGPQQKEFGSDVRLFGRVFNSGSIATDTMEQYYPERESDSVSVIGTIKDLFNFEQFPTLAANEYVFYNYDYTKHNNNNLNSSPDSSSLVARINTKKQFGIPLPANGAGSGFAFSNTPQLNVFETSPVESLIDIYYETTTAGTIENLNSAIETGPAANVFSFVEGGEFNGIFQEDLKGQNDPTNPDEIEICTAFEPLRLGGAQFSNPQANTCVLLSVNNQLSQPLPNDSNEEGFPYTDGVVTSDGIFSVQQVPTTGKFKIILSRTNTNTSPGSGPNNAPGLVVAGGEETGHASYEYDFKLEFGNPEAVPFEFTFSNIRLGNVPPSKPIVEFVPFDSSGTQLLTCCTAEYVNACASHLVAITTDQFSTRTNTGYVFGAKSTNGSSTASLAEKDITYEITYLAEGSGPSGQFVTIYDKTSSGSDGDLSNLNGYFYVDYFGEAGFTGSGNDARFNSGNYQAMIGMGFAPTGSDEIGATGPTLVKDNVVYQMHLTAFDGGVLGENQGSASCRFTFIFLTDPLVKFPGANFLPVQAGGLLSPLYSFSPYVTSGIGEGRNGNGQVWNNPQDTIFPINDQGEVNWGDWQSVDFSPKRGTFVGNISVLNDRVRISAHKVFIKKDTISSNPQNNAPATTPGTRSITNNFVLTKPLGDGSLPSITAQEFANSLANPNAAQFDIQTFLIPGGTAMGAEITLTGLPTIELAANYGVGASTNFGILLNTLDMLDILQGPPTLDANITVQVQLKAEIVP